MGEKKDKKEKKSKKEVEDAGSGDVPKTLILSPIAQPLADDKLSKKVRLMSRNIGV
jgi:hypothetical protein